MRVHVVRSGEAVMDGTGTCLVAPLHEKRLPLVSDVLGGEDELVLQAVADRNVFTGKAEELYYLHTPASRYGSVLVTGMGEMESCGAERMRRVAGAACGVFKQQRVAHVYLDLSHHAHLPADAFVEGIVLGQYSFDVYKHRSPDSAPPARVESITVLVGDDAGAAAVQEQCEMAALIAAGVNGARHLANTAANEMTPTALAQFAQGIADESDAECTVLDQVQMSSLGMNALLGVAKGSAEPPKLIVLKYTHPEAKRTVAMVGKGVTFDSGGISIKPSSSMHEMKYDMCGAAAVLSAMMNVTELKPRVNVYCVVPAVENKTGAAAQTPGDIVKAYNGKTIEVHNTDAEGRLILADAMAFLIDKYHPDAVVDVATLTGACVVALGHYAAGLFSTDDALRQELEAAAQVSGDRVWPMPLWPEYEKLIEGTHADLCNIGPAGEAGAITAAAFLKNFAGNTPWAHLDIAGAAWGGKHIPYLDAKHATGYGVRLLTRWVLAMEAPG